MSDLESPHQLKEHQRRCGGNGPDKSAAAVSPVGSANVEMDTILDEMMQMSERFDGDVRGFKEGLSDEPGCQAYNIDDTLEDFRCCACEFKLCHYPKDFNEIFIRPESANRMLHSVIPYPSTIVSHVPLNLLTHWEQLYDKLSIRPQRVDTGRSVLKPVIKNKASPRRNVSNNNAVTIQKPAKNLESDGDSLRSYSPQSILTDPEDDEPIFFKHDSSQIFSRNVSGKLSEYISNGAAMASIDVPKDKITSTNQRNRHYVWIKEEDKKPQIMNEIQKNTLSDHCYYLSQETKSHKRELEATSSESDEEDEEMEEVEEAEEAEEEVKVKQEWVMTIKEEVDLKKEEEEEDEEMEEDEEDEIDVVSLKKEPAYYNHTFQKHQRQLQISANQQGTVSATKRPFQSSSPHLPFSMSVNQLHQQPVSKPIISTNQLGQQSAVSAKQLKQQSINADNTIVRRPRGRPPGSNSAKRKNPFDVSAQKPSRVQNYQRRKSPQRRTKRARISSEENENDENRRSQHNNMERQRRISLRNLFDQLKMNVPAIASQEKVAKVVILRQAYDYIKSVHKLHPNLPREFLKLSTEEVNITEELELLQQQQNRLKKRLERLQMKLQS